MTPRVTWHLGPMLALDTETTGPDPHLDRIVTITLAHLHGTKGPGRVDTWLIAPDVPIGDGATAVHGITNERAHEDGQPAWEVLTQVAAILAANITNNVPLVAYNAAFDLTILDRELTRAHITDCPLDQAVVIDPYVLDKQHDRYRKGSRKLDATAAHYGVRLDGAHDATQDALAAARVAWAMANRYPHLQAPPPVLHDLQTQWRAQQCASLQDYFARQGKDERIDPTWPIHPAPAGWDPTHTPTNEEHAA